MAHLIGWNEELAARCRTEPGDVVPLVSSLLFHLSTRRDVEGGETRLSGRRAN